MKYYTVIDTNVLVSAMLKHHSVPGSIIDLAFDGPIIPVLNDAIEKEYREVLSRTERRGCLSGDRQYQAFPGKAICRNTETDAEYHIGRLGKLLDSSFVFLIYLYSADRTGTGSVTHVTSPVPFLCSNFSSF